MSTYRELVYMVMDRMKLSSDDTYFNEDHVLKLLDNHRSTVLKQKYSDPRVPIPENNYQTLCFKLQEVPSIPGEYSLQNENFLRSTYKIPAVMPVVLPRIESSDCNCEISYTNRRRLKYVGYNKFTRGTAYGTIAEDKYLYIKPLNSKITKDNLVLLTAVFQSAVEASDYECTQEGEKIECDILDREFPMSEYLIPVIIDLTIKDLSISIYSPEDDKNNASDDLSKVQVKK